MINRVSLKAYAKINLGLDVLGTLPNGYHEVRMIMQSIDLYDKVNIFRNRTGKIDIKTNLEYLPVGQDNLVYKAIKMLKDEFNIYDGINVDLFKIIPVAAGMAGGSTDAAAALKGMNEMFGLGLSTEELMERGAKLGADVPYCIMSGTALAEGIGEKLTKLPDCPQCHIVIGKPPVSVSTKVVYDKLIIDDNTVHPDIDGIIEGINNNNINTVASKLSNILETVTKSEYPIIAEIENDMMEHGAIGSIMSGSGPTVFGIFDDEEKAMQCKDFFRKGNKTRNSYIVRPVNG